MALFRYLKQGITKIRHLYWTMMIGIHHFVRPELQKPGKVILHCAPLSVLTLVIAQFYPAYITICMIAWAAWLVVIMPFIAIPFLFQRLSPEVVEKEIEALEEKRRLKTCLPKAQIPVSKKRL